MLQRRRRGISPYGAGKRPIIDQLALRQAFVATDTWERPDRSDGGAWVLRNAGYLDKASRGSAVGFNVPLYQVTADFASLIEKYRFFNAIYHLTEQPTREQIVRYAIENFDYTL
jgi:hypothetical protein